MVLAGAFTLGLSRINLTLVLSSVTVSHHDLGICWKIFKRWDLEKRGKININDLFGGILGEQRNM